MAELIEIRILPPVAIARMGNAETKAENYTLMESDSWRDDGYRSLQFEETVLVDANTGQTTVDTSRVDIPVSPEDFKDAEGRVKPVAPFLEVWGVFRDVPDNDDALVPLTPAALASVGLSQAHFEWTVDIANRKLVRRTGDDQDAILLIDRDEMKGGVVISADHYPVVELRARASNFADAGASILLGSAQSLAHENDEPLKLRLTPGAGKVYQQQLPNPGETNREQIELAGQWPSYNRTDLDPLPGGLINAGIFDDSCDGIISVSLKENDMLSASARISVGPPDFSPDTQFLRSIDDEMEQIIKGVDIIDEDYPDTDEGDKQLVNDIVDIMQRATDTMRMANPAGMIRWWTRSRDNPNGEVPTNWQQRLQYRQVVEKHAQWLHNLGAYRKSSLSGDEKYRLSKLLEGFSRRMRTQTNIAVAQDPGAWLMPFLMRGSNGDFVILSERQRNKIIYAAERFARFAPDSALARLRSIIWARAEPPMSG